REQLLEDGFPALVGVLHRNLVTPHIVQSLTAADTPTSLTVGATKLWTVTPLPLSPSAMTLTLPPLPSTTLL
ncbi:hypothetical protein, partial [Halomonas sp. MM17-34]|uniref:hypothetical protein n=1 Tax=Halomonas sp. MM17-34 TaxID=2917742 RepID=UPI001EF58C07